MLNSRKLGQMIKWLAMSSEGSKHYRKLASDEAAYEYTVTTQIPPGMAEDFKAAYHTCPAEGPDSLKAQTLRHMKKLLSYKAVQ